MNSRIVLGYFIDPAHPHKHNEVIFAVKKALAVIDTDLARGVLQENSKRSDKGTSFPI